MAVERTNMFSLKRSVIPIFSGNSRSLECLDQDVFMARPKKGEFSLDFGNRLQVLRNLLHSIFKIFRLLK